MDRRSFMLSLSAAGAHTRSIDLVGGDRFIKSVSFTYGKFPNGNGPTYVEVRGRR